MSSCAEARQFGRKQAEVQDTARTHSSIQLQDGDSYSYALADLEANGKLRHSISLDQLLSVGVEQREQMSRRRNVCTEAQLDSAPSYSTSMLFKPSPVRAGAKHRLLAAKNLQAACEDASTFPHLPGGDTSEIASGDMVPVETGPVSPTYASLLSRLNFLGFTSTSQNPSGPNQQGSTDALEYQPHPLTRSMSEAMLPSLGEHCSAEPACSVSNTRRQHSDTSASALCHARAQSCAHPLTRFDFSESECSTPVVSPRAPTSARTQPTCHADRSPRHIYHDDSHLSVHTCELSDAQDSPVTSPTSLTSIGSFFFSGILPMLTSPEPSVRDCSGSVDLNGNEDSLGASQASTSSSIEMENLCAPVSPEPVVAHRISQPTYVIPDDVLTPPCVRAWSCDSPPVHTTVSLSTAFDMTLPSWPLPTDVLPRSCVDSYCMMDEELAQSAASPSDVQQQHPPQESAAPSPPSGKAGALMAAVDRELSGVACGCNTSAAIREHVPEQLLVQLMSIMSTATDIQSAEAEGVKASVGPGTLCGSSRNAVGRFEMVQTSVDKSTGLTFICEKQPLRNRLHMYRTRFRVPNASIDTMQTYMLNDHIVRNANASMLSYVRLEDPSAGCSSGMHAQRRTDHSLATDSGFLYSKIRFPVIGARQYVACRRVWHLPAGEGFCIVSTACEHPSIIAQAKALEDAQGLGDKAWSTDFWAGYVVRPYEEDGVKGVEVGSVTFDDLGVPAFLANNASVPGLWAGARSFSDGFRSFEQTLANCRENGEDIFRVVQQDVHGQQDAHSAQERVPSRSRGWRKRLRRAAVVMLSGGLVFSLR